MMIPFYPKETFLKLPSEAIAELVQQKGKPKVGIFIPDGNRRLFLSMSGLPEDSNAFGERLAVTQAIYGLQNIEIFFRYKLSILFVPLFSHSVLARGKHYKPIALKTLKMILTHEKWLNSYHSLDIRVRIYGDITGLACMGYEEIVGDIDKVQQMTRNHSSHILFLGIGGKSRVGFDIIKPTVAFYELHHREPSEKELIKFFYGQDIPSADFFIMSSKFSGAGALPALVCGKGTSGYYLISPGIKALTDRTYRRILYDLLYLSSDSIRKNVRLSLREQQELKDWYSAHDNTVIGLRKKIGAVLVPDLSEI